MSNAIKFCFTCGAPNAPDAEKCTSCGQDLAASSQPPRPALTVPLPSPDVLPPSPAMTYRLQDEPPAPPPAEPLSTAEAYAMPEVQPGETAVLPSAETYALPEVQPGGSAVLPSAESYSAQPAADEFPLPPAPSPETAPPAAPEKPFDYTPPPLPPSPPPPPAAPAKPKRNWIVPLIIALVIALCLCCLCMVLVLGFFWSFGDQIFYGESALPGLIASLAAGL
jgi:hypothetical protein